MLAVLEYISILCGVNIRYDKILWSAISDYGRFEYTQTMDKDYTLKCDGKIMTAFVDGMEVFSSPVDNRVETDMQGNILNIYELK